MTMTEHTPGPWSACKKADCKCGMIWDVTGNCLVAVSQCEDHMTIDAGPDCTPNYEGQQANALLIAAAPELLAAALELIAHCPSCAGTGQAVSSEIKCPECCRMRAALAKATAP
jgi:hypothetical protein